MTSTRRQLQVDPGMCLGCGACVVLCPRVFHMGASGTAEGGIPSTAADQRLADMALLNCPAHAIRSRPAPADGPAVRETAPRSMFEELAALSERVRWPLSSVPWDDLRPAAASTALQAMVREMAFSEQATYSATQRFMQAFWDDVEFSQWLSVWFYEETRHPHVLLAWLQRVGAAAGADTSFVLKGRVSTPFMRSRMGTLVTNVVSEVTAASAYVALSQSSLEPALSAITGRIAGDEARHAASFLRFADRRIATAEDPARERLDALKVLHFWLYDEAQVTHPIRQMMSRAGDTEGLGDLAFDLPAVQKRATRIVGLLVDLPLAEPSELPALVERLTRERQAAARPAPREAGGVSA